MKLPFGAILVLSTSCSAALDPTAPASARVTSGRTLHVWKESPAPSPPDYPTRQSAARAIQDALAFAVAGDTVQVHGQCDLSPTGRCTYSGNLSVPCGVTLSGDGDQGSTPLVMGDGHDSVIKNKSNCTNDQEVQISYLDVEGGKAYRGGGILLNHSRGVIDHDCIIANTATIGGGVGVYFLGSDNYDLPVVRIEDNCIEKNNAFWRGAGVSIESDATNPSGIADFHAQVLRNTFDTNMNSGNKQTYSWGGGMELYKARAFAASNLFKSNQVAGTESY
jgi:hypothetical protein